MLANSRKADALWTHLLHIPGAVTLEYACHKAVGWLANGCVYLFSSAKVRTRQQTWAVQWLGRVKGSDPLCACSKVCSVLKSAGMWQY